MRWICAILCVLFLSASVQADGLTTWVMGSDVQAEARVGLARGDAEIAIAGLYRDTTEVVGDEAWGVRGYGLYSVVDANMVASLIGGSYTLPPGNLYLGAYAGLDFETEETEAGLLVGGAIGPIRIEYQYALDQGVLPDQYAILLGVRWEW